MPILFKTTEVRWFFPGEIPARIQDRLTDLGDLQHMPPRVDLYLPGSGSGKGIKMREGRLEIKIRRKQYGCFDFSDSVAGCVESWIKWGIKLRLTPRAWVPVHKTRQILYYQIAEDGELLPSMPSLIPYQGGGVELTQVLLGGEEPWWTIGIEVFGPGANQLDVIEKITKFVIRGNSLNLLAEHSYGYPRLVEKYRGMQS